MKTKKTLFSKQIEADIEAHKLSIALNMVGLGVNIRISELILKAQAAYKKMGGKFDLETASKIQVEVDRKYAMIQSDFEAEI